MFERILLAPNQTVGSQPCDIGAVAEALLFYKETILTLHYGGFFSLIQNIGADNFLKLLDETNIKFKFLTDQPSTATSNGTHRFLCTALAYQKAGGAMDGPDLIKQAIFRVTARSGYSRDCSKKISDKTEFLNSSAGFPKGKIISQVAQEEIKYLNIQRSIPQLIAFLAPEYPLDEGCRFNVVSTRNGMTVDSDINFEKLTALHKSKFSQSNFQITQALLLNHFLDSYLDISLASKFDASIYTNPVRGIIAGNIITTLSKDAQKGDSLDKAKLFQEHVLSNSRTIREVINSGERNITELIELINSAQKFKNWTEGIDSDRDLIREYVESISTTSWAEKLPGKIVRFLILAGMSTADPTLGGAAGIFDNFALENITQRWRPSMFIEHLECFTEPSINF